MKKMFLILVLVVFSLGCPQHPAPDTTTVPTELPFYYDITYASGATHIEWGSFEFNADTSGNANLIAKRGMYMEVRKDFTLTDEELLEIYKAVIVNDFFSLDSSYKNPAIMDGGWESIGITVEEYTKTVRVTNAHQPQFDAITAKIMGLVTEKLGVNALDMRPACPEKRIECKDWPNIYKCAGSKCDLSTDACEEWAEFCEWDPEKPPEELPPAVELTPEYCDKLSNREECIEHCFWNFCSQDLCDTLVFEAPECTECGAGCCEQCDDLSSCTAGLGCGVAWVLPSGGAYEFGGCQNMDLCMGTEEICSILSNNYQGYEVAAAIEEDSSIAATYQELSELLEESYSSNCN